MILPYIAWIAFGTLCLTRASGPTRLYLQQKREGRAVRTKEDSSRFHPRRVNRVLVQALVR
jgi:hypothetical protein